MDPIQQRLQAAYHSKSESDIDRKLKSASTTVLDQRIVFHDASKAPSCPNANLKGKYLFMKSPPSSPSVAPVKKDYESQNNNATSEHEEEEGQAQSPRRIKLKKKSERERKSSSSARSRSPLEREPVPMTGDEKSTEKKTGKKKKRKIKKPALTPSWIESSEGSSSEDTDVTKKEDSSAQAETPTNPRSESPKPGTSTGDDISSSSSDDSVASEYGPRRHRTPRLRSPSSRRDRVRRRSPGRGGTRIPLPPSLLRKMMNPCKNNSAQKCVIPPSWKSETTEKKKQGKESSTAERIRNATERMNGTERLSTEMEITSNAAGGSGSATEGTSPTTAGTSYVTTGTTDATGGTSFATAGTSSAEAGTSSAEEGTSNAEAGTSYSTAGTSDATAGTSDATEEEETEFKIDTGFILVPNEQFDPDSEWPEAVVVVHSGKDTDQVASSKSDTNRIPKYDDGAFDSFDFKEYLQDNFENLPFYPSTEEVRESDNVFQVFTAVAGDEGDGLPHPETVLCPENRLDYSWKYPEGGCGLVNRGNTCFVNAALQCLTYTPPLVNYLLSGHHSSECRIMQKDRCILCSFTRYLQESLRINKCNLVPNWFLNNLYSIAKHFSVGRQEDSHEYLRLSLEQMQKVCLVGHNKLDRYSKETTVVNQIFGGFLRSQVVCLKCRAKSNTYDPVLDISLDIRNCNTLEKAFEIFVTPERLDIENAYKCSKCKQKVEALKRFTIHKAPNILTIQLKRFQGTHDDKFGGTFRGVKINKAIKFPPRLNIRGFMSIRSGPPEIYGLYALLFHEGHSANSGHYTCTVKSGSRWFHISDGSKIRTSLHTVNLQDVYVLFYMREDKQQNGIIQNPSLKSEEQKAKEAKEKQRQSSFTNLPSTSGLQKPSPYDMQKPSTSGLQKPSSSGLQQPSTSGTQKFIGPVKPKIIHTNEFQFKPVKTNSVSDTTSSSDLGTPIARKEAKFTPQKPDAIKVPLAADRNKVSFGIKTPSKAHSPSASPHVKHESKMASSKSEPVLNVAKPRIVMQIKHGKCMTIETSPDGQKKIVSDDEEVVAKTEERKSHKKFKKSLLVPYAAESSSDTDSGSKVEDKPKVKKKEKRETEDDVVFDTKLNATTSVPGNLHLMKSISSHLANSSPSKPTVTLETSKSTDSVQDEKPSKNENVSNNCQESSSGIHMKHRNGDIHIYDSATQNSHAEDRHHAAGKKRKLIEDARIDMVNGEFHVVSEKIPLLDPVEHSQRDKDSEEYRLLKKAKKHKKHKKDKHRHKEHKYEELINESDMHSDHQVKKHKKKKRKHKERDYDIEEEHSYKKRKYEEPSEVRAPKRHHHFETEERVHKRPRHESESSSSAEFEWVERKVDTPAKVSKSAFW